MVRRPSLDSFELLSPTSGSQISTFTNSDDDEIVWGVSSLSLSDRALFSPRSEDFVILSPPSVSSSYATGVPAFVEDDLISNPPILTRPTTPQPHSPSRGDRKRPCNAHAQQQRQPNARGKAPPRAPSTPSDKKAPTSSSPQSPKRGKGRSGKRNDACLPKGKDKSLIVVPPAPKSPTRGFAARSVVDDVSERGDDKDSIFGDGCPELSPAVYDKAVQYINCFLSNPLEHKAADLALLQALIIELGFFSPPNRSGSKSDSGRSTPSFELSDIPQSMTSAKAFIKSHVFMNVRDYLALREQGQEALKNALHPSRKSLVTELRRKGTRVPRDLVKQRGLKVLLVTCF